MTADNPNSDNDHDDRDKDNGIVTTVEMVVGVLKALAEAVVVGEGGGGVVKEVAEQGEEEYYIDGSKIYLTVMFYM